MVDHVSSKVFAIFHLLWQNTHIELNYWNGKVNNLGWQCQQAITVRISFRQRQTHFSSIFYDSIENGKVQKGSFISLILCLPLHTTVCPLNSFNFNFAVCAWLIASVIRQPTVLAGQVYKVKAKSNGKNRPKFPVLYKRTRVNVDFIQNYQQYSCTLKRALKQQTARAICT